MHYICTIHVALSSGNLTRGGNSCSAVNMSDATTTPLSPSRTGHRWTSGTNPRNQNPKGRDVLTNEFDTFNTKPFDEQRKEVDQSWLELAYVLPRRALRLALTATKKEMGQVQQIVTAAAIAKDKRFPNDDGQFLIKLPSAMLAAYSVSIKLAPIASTPQPVDITPTSVDVTEIPPGK